MSRIFPFRFQKTYASEVRGDRLNYGDVDYETVM
jgi:hypothetical protein